MNLKPIYTLDAIKAWRQAQHDACKPSSLKDFYKAHDICVVCKGKQVIVPTAPADYAGTCYKCNGDGRYHEVT